MPALGDLAVSLYLPGEVQATTIHGSAFQTNYVSLPGNFTGSATLPTGRTITAWPFLTEVDVSAPGAGAIVALGDSITDGAVTTVDANRRWPDLLALRLQTTRDSATGAAGAGTGTGTGTGISTGTGAGKSASTGASASAGKGGASQAAPTTASPALRVNSRLGVVNRGIGGDRLLRDPGEQPLFGRAALVRFDRDVLATSGVRHLIVLIGINDIGHPGTGTIPVTEAVTAQDLIAGYRQLIARAHAKGIPVYGATLTPFEGTIFPGYYSPEKEAVRQAVNNWIRGSDEFDAVIDFDRAVRDPANPTRMLPAYDSGDHLHPNDLGMQAMANAIPLDLFRSVAFGTGTSTGTGTGVAGPGSKGATGKTGTAAPAVPAAAQPALR